ncbi:methyltransferase domain-containing protein [Nonomuraea sp. NPDC050328]|uniref:class I SAM-dependent methyltransferase n=1 Tax=Nonomuraea sp. NPDC050328 TaxID=3364361 RepID=UPI0037B9753E
MDLDAFLALQTPRGQAALAEAVELTGADPVAAATRLRKTYDAALTSAALTQAGLRARAQAKFGADAARMYFTPHGLEQATRADVAAHRARRLAGLHVVDVCCGIGGDLLALARAGCRVDACDLDPLTVAVAQANADALGLGDLISVRTADAASIDPAGYDALFADPARRTARGRTFDPDAYSPPWPVVVDLLARARAACVKVAPGLPYELIPEDAEAEWVSYRGEVKEAALWTGPLAGHDPTPPGLEEHARRRATLLPGGHTLTPTGAVAASGPVAKYLYEPDGAAVRAHLVAEVADLVGGHLIDPMIAYITSDVAVDSPWAARYEIHDTLPFSLKRLRAVLRERQVGNVTIKKRGSAVDIERLRADLRLSGPNTATVILTRIADKPFMLLGSPHPPA